MDASLACRNGHENPHVTIFCGAADCGDWILFRRTGGRRLNGFCIAVLIVCVLAALFLFRRTASVWAIDAFLTLCLLNVFLVALSRGRALGAAAVSTALAMGVWLVWWGLDPVNQAGTFAARWGPSILLVAAIGYAFLAGRLTVLETVAVRGTYLSVMLVAVPGLWWTIAVGLDGGLGYTTLVDVAIAVGVIVPLVFVMVMIGNGPNSVAAQ